MRSSELELLAFAGHDDVDAAAAVLKFSDPREDDRSRPRDEDGNSEELASGARVNVNCFTLAAPSPRSPDWSRLVGMASAPKASPHDWTA